jgi:predicted ester cyclase
MPNDATASGGHMTESDAARVLRRMVAAFATGDARDCHEYISTSYIDRQGRSGSALHGPDGFRQVVRAAHRTTAPHLSIEDLIADETRAVARLRWRFVESGKGNVTERETIEVVRIDDGQAVEHWGAEAWSRTLHRGDDGTAG